jgi:hypothetical protein
LAQLASQFAGQNIHLLSPITSINESRFPQQANLVRRWWSQALRFDPKKKTSEKPPEKVNAVSKKPAMNPRSAILRLINTIRGVEGNLSNDLLRAGLETFEKTTGENRLDRALEMVAFPDAQVVRQAYRSLRSQFKLNVLEKGWEDQGARSALDSTRQGGICILFFIVNQEKENGAQETLARLQDTVPEGIKMFTLSYWKYKSKQDGTPLLKVEIIVSQPMEKKVP